MAHWHGTVSKCFGQQGFLDYLASLPHQDWKPQFIVLHNTAEPTIGEWHNVSGEDRMKGLASYYQSLGWSGGPHLFVADDWIWVFNPLNLPGVHSPSWNGVSLGVEMVGDYSSEDFFEGIGGDVHSNSVFAVAALSVHFGLDSSTMRLHKEDPATTHDCPGHAVVKSVFIQEVHDKKVEIMAAKAAA